MMFKEVKLVRLIDITSEAHNMHLDLITFVPTAAHAYCI